MGVSQHCGNAASDWRKSVAGLRKGSVLPHRSFCSFLSVLREPVVLDTEHSLRGAGQLEPDLGMMYPTYFEYNARVWASDTEDVLQRTCVIYISEVWLHFCGVLKWKGHFQEAFSLALPGTVSHWSEGAVPTWLGLTMHRSKAGTLSLRRCRECGSDHCSPT
jgi:hypothetical protein